MSEKQKEAVITARSLGVGIGVSLVLYAMALLVVRITGSGGIDLLLLFTMAEVAACTHMVLQKLDRLLGKTGGAPSGAAAAEEPGQQTTDTESK